MSRDPTHLVPPPLPPEATTIGPFTGGPSAAASAPRDRLKFAAVVLSMVAASVLLFVRDPSKPGSYGRCPFYLLTGCYCPGCGSLRGLHQLLHGRLGAAMALNPVMVLSLPFLGYGFVRFARQAVLGIPPDDRRLPPWLIRAVAVLLTVYWVLRNVPAYPFTYLAPHALPAP